jgi:hypothetical protein
MNRDIRKTVLLALLALLSLAILIMAGRARAKQANTLEVLTGFSSKETCSCAFVVEQTDEYCTAFGKPPGFDVAISIDRKAKTVKSTVGNVARIARMTEGEGCTLEALP